MTTERQTPLIDAAQDLAATGANDERRARDIAERHGLDVVDMATFRIDNDLFRSIPFELMLRYNFVPQEQLEGRLAVVMADPTDVIKLDELELLLSQPVEVRVGARAAIGEILQRSESAQRVLDEATEDFKLQLVGEDDEGDEVLSIDRISHDTSPIIKLVDSTIFNAIQRRASDIHIETRESEVVIKYRIDGVLYQAMEPIDKRHHQTVISRIKVMAELDIAEKRIPQDGRFKLRFEGRTIDFRVSVMPSVHGEDCVIRILDKESMNKEFKELRLDILGLDSTTMRKVRKFIREPYGMVLVTGPTGSGKTTTLYACLSEIQSSEDKIVTIEDPVEYQLRGITQIPVNEKKGLTFARGLRSILRHDPDKIMVGEIRDQETAQIAVQSALTGHLVFTTVHANNVIDVLGRFLEHEGRPLQLRVGLELRAGPEAGAARLRELPAGDRGRRRALRRERSGSGAARRHDVLRGCGLLRVQRHRLLRSHGHFGAARSLGSHPRADSRAPPGVRDQACGARRGDEIPSRVSVGEGVRGSHDTS